MVVSLVVVVLWLALSYMPGISLPELAYPAWSGSLLAVVAGLGLVAFVAIQFWIVQSTDRAVARVEADSKQNATPEPTSLRVRRGPETFWTALPLVMTVLVATGAVGAWRALF